jgi:hypothetical protein
MATTTIRAAAVTMVGLAIVFAGCATMTSGKETMLQQAGFRQVPADTAKKMAHLGTLPERKLISRTHQGQVYYVYADSTYCKCLYVGKAAQYQAYQRLAKEQQVSMAEASATEDAREWETDACCGP